MKEDQFGSDPSAERKMKEYLVPFRDEIMDYLDNDPDGYMEIWKKYPKEYIENLIRDKVIAYMGDKESERTGTEEDVIDIATICYLLWARKRNDNVP